LNLLDQIKSILNDAHATDRDGDIMRLLMSEELYLIAHKVRGRLAFDVATKVQIGEEFAWIIPTSGWRAYPVAQMWWKLSELSWGEARGLDIIAETGPLELHPDFASARDHFHSEAQSSDKPGRLTSLNLADLGL